ncbi:hypothetical protein ACJJIF_04045 [Microbulbifer sp. SSSA002]|uniref:hypothetical protein n=1 Tax=Microbulbifer sp. SSSA002 TaxID=3243376 RepID=UPI00403A4E7A
MSKFKELIGKWKHAAPWDSDDYLAVYEISGTEDRPLVSGYDINDNEEFVISDIQWVSDTLVFKSLMPSTERVGINKFWLSEAGRIKSEFTFTVVEELVREKT